MKRSMSLSAVLALAVSATVSVTDAHADQCIWTPREVAERARVTLLRPHTEVVRYCEPCRESLARAHIERVRTVEVRPVRGGQYFELVVNGRAMDLAYLFARAPGQRRFTNVGLSVSCGARLVSRTIQVGVASRTTCAPGSRCAGENGALFME